MSSIKWHYSRPLSDTELHEISHQILSEDLPLDNNIDTDVEGSDNEENFETSLPNTFENSFKRSETDLTTSTEDESAEIADNRNTPKINILQNYAIVAGSCCSDKPDTSSCNVSNDRRLRSSVLESEQVEHEEEEERNNDIQDPANRIWKKKNVETILPNYYELEGLVEAFFAECETPTDVFRKVLGDVVEDITFQSNLYSVQKNKRLNLTENELLTFIGINFLMINFLTGNIIGMAVLT
ncbi:hypothetical protein RN001_013678 [Aquatica leii]|uniref:PiggyBac transposable element-derived protein domain-containing protein n=1 Tax=Aquatica leii TaxID=1421715 RepID=A0AAN7SLP8_9COLE|nr:hypothetical protein RN001_013678 [Aquatica leii]